MPVDSAATRQRIRDAAFREFARHGLAGARIDRIADNARANKRAIYAYFGNKEELFDIVVAHELDLGAQTVPARYDNLPEHAGRLFAYLTSDPDRIRLNMWRQLERPAATEAEIADWRAQLAAFRATQSADETIEPVDLLSIVWAVINAWFLSFTALRLTSGDDVWSSQRLATHREAVVEAVRRVLAPQAPDTRPVPPG